MYARLYSPVISRWTTRDPFGMADGPNLYEYVGSNPIQFVDTMGLKKERVCALPNDEGFIGPLERAIARDCDDRLRNEIFPPIEDKLKRDGRFKPGDAKCRYTFKRNGETRSGPPENGDFDWLFIFNARDCKDDDYRCAVAHEYGHYYLGHVKEPKNDVERREREEAANNFMLYIFPDCRGKIKKFMH